MNNLLQGVNVYLIGMMGSGKSTIGKILAQKLNYRFFDTDVLIEGVAGKPIPSIFANEGEDYFRDLETQVLKEVSAYRSSAIVATGGGIIQKEINRDYLSKDFIVWLNVDVEILRKRISGDENRPLAETVESLFIERYPLYSKLANLPIKCVEEQTPEQVANRIIEQIPGMIINK